MTTDIVMYRMPDVVVGSDDLFVSYILSVNGKPIQKSTGIFPSPVSPPLEWPKDLETIALNLGLALGVKVQYRDARVKRFKYPGVNVAIPIRQQ